MTQTPADALQAHPTTIVRDVVLSDAVLEGIETLAGALGMRVYVVDLAGCESKPDLLERAARALRFPDWFGHNWDAWFDCLTDLGWQPPATAHVLVLRHSTALRRAAPEVLDTALAIVEDAAHVWAGRGLRMVALVDSTG